MEIFGFLPVSFIDILDILMVAVIIYLLFRWMRGSSAMNILIAVFLLLFVRLAASALGMKLMSAIFGTLIDVGVLALIIIFQPEIRHMLIKMGNESAIMRKIRQGAGHLFGIKEAQMATSDIDEIAKACSEMSDSKTGALIVFPHKTSLQYIVETGDQIDAKISKRLIENIFYKNSPLHDGAMVMVPGRIVAARCTLPITQNSDISPTYGMRHKAAIGMSEESDADIVVVSEQTGRISFVREGKVQKIQNINELKLLLGAALGDNRLDTDGKDGK